MSGSDRLSAVAGRCVLLLALCCLGLTTPFVHAQTKPQPALKAAAPKTLPAPEAEQPDPNPWPADKVANGKIDDIICGVHGEDATVKGIEALLGKGRLLDPHDTYKTYLWVKTSLHIKMVTAEDGGSVSILEVTGSDPQGACKSARGLQLGQAFAEVETMYGHVYDVYRYPNGDVQYTFVWQANGDYYLQLTFDKKSHKLIKINAQYSLE